MKSILEYNNINAEKDFEDVLRLLERQLNFSKWMTNFFNQNSEFFEII